MERDKYINSVNLNAESDFPYLVLNVIGNKAYPRNPGFQIMHWHEDLQFIYVFEGSIELQTLESSVLVHAGQGIFINQNVIHNVRQFEGCHYNSFLFPPYFLFFYSNSPAEEFVDSITASSEITIIHFSMSEPWHAEILEHLQHLSKLENNKTDFYSYEVLVCLCRLWLVLRRNIVVPQIQKESVIHMRMQKILAYIESHYGEDITLKDLSKSADISKSECGRCFKVSMNTTPYKYLTEYRLSKAAKLLKQTTDPIGNIASDVGFHQMSHFGKCFKEKTGYSPKEYREL